MKTYKISRAWLHVDNINITAENEEQALELAQEADDSLWKHIDGFEDTNYQIEGESPCL